MHTLLSRPLFFESLCIETLGLSFQIGIVLTVASAGLIPALIGANAALDFADRQNASKMRVACGYEALSHGRILGDVATNAGISMGLTAIDLGLGSDVARVQANSSN